MIFFGSGKCPLCGAFGQEIEENIFYCDNCQIPFSEFGLPMDKEYEELEDVVFWN